MDVYDESGKKLQEGEYDLAKGHLVPSTRKIHHDAVEGVEEVGHWETVREYPETGGKDVEWVVDVPGVEARGAWDEIEEIMLYVPYTEEELAAIRERIRKAEEETRRPDEMEAALCELADMLADNQARLDEQDAALLELASMIAGRE